MRCHSRSCAPTNICFPKCLPRRRQLLPLPRLSLVVVTLLSSGSGVTPPGTHLPVDISADWFTQLMAAITGTHTSLNSKLAEFKKEIAESQDRAATSAARKVQASKDTYTFKKSHKERYKANTNIDEASHETKIELKATVPSDPAATSTVKRAKDALLRGRKLFVGRSNYFLSSAHFW